MNTYMDTYTIKRVRPIVGKVIDDMWSKGFSLGEMQDMATLLTQEAQYLIENGTMANQHQEIVKHAKILKNVL